MEWNGSAWTALPSLASGQRAGAITCSSLSECTAVGKNAYEWNGAAWTEQKTPGPTPSLGTWTGVACTAATSCIAVGSYTPDCCDFPAADVLSDGGWRQVRVPDTNDESGGVLDAASCLPGGVCVEVGDAGVGIVEEPSALVPYASVGPPGPQVEMKVVSPPGAFPRQAFSSVSCERGHSCLLLGEAATPLGGTHSTAEVLSGHAWKITAGPPSPMNDVSCTSAHSCEAVGGAGLFSNTVGAASWNGRTWTKQAPAIPNNENSPLLSVSCTSPDNCQAVGDFFDFQHKADRFSPFAEGWNGTKWSLEKMGIGDLNADVVLNEVSCPAPNNCTAVGTTSAFGVGTHSLSRPLVEHWNGTNWTVERTPSAAPLAQLSVVSCSSATSCVAVGATLYNTTFFGPQPLAPLAESWNGTTWSIMATAPLQHHGELVGVSCSSIVSCTAVGFERATPELVGTPLAEALTGTTWARQPVPAPAHGDFLGVSCPRPTVCEAFGGPTPLVEGFRG